MTFYLVSMNGADPEGGVERMTSYWADLLKSYGAVVIVSKKDRFFAPLGSLLKSLRASRLQSFAFSIYASMRLLFARSSKCVIAQGGNACFARADFLIAHGSMAGLHRALYEGRSQWGPRALHEWMEKLAGRRCRVLVAVSARAGQEWQQYYGVPSERIRVLFNCFDERRFHPTLNHPSGGKRRCLFVGRLDRKVKGLDRLENLISRLPSNWEVHMAAPDRKGLSSSLGDSSQVVFHERAEASLLNRLYNESDLLLLTSRYEGCELVTLESLGAGCPVIGTAVGAVSALVAQGMPGVFLMPSDPKDLLAMMDSVATAGRTTNLRQQVAHRAVEIFSMKPYVTGVRSLLREQGFEPLTAGVAR